MRSSEFEPKTGTATKTFPKNKWVFDISDSDKHEVGDNLVDLVQTAYKSTELGSFISAVKDVIPSHWNVLDFDEYPDVDVCIFYRNSKPGENWTGNKIQGIGHDGSKAAKIHAITGLTNLLRKPGWWSESNGKMGEILYKLNLKPVTDVNFLKQLFNDPNIQMIDQSRYSRKLHNGQTIIETVFGKPVLK